MLTVQILIDALQQVEDKSIPVVINDGFELDKLVLRQALNCHQIDNAFIILKPEKTRQYKLKPLPFELNINN